MNSLIIGGSSGLGRSLAEQLAKKKYNVYLVSSDKLDLEAVTNDLKIRYDVKVGCLQLDLREFDVDTLIKNLNQEFGEIDNLFFVAGLGNDNDIGAVSDKTAKDLIEVNFMSGIRIINAFLPTIMGKIKSNIVAIGSVASVRGRNKNIIYGASKRGLEFYFEAIKHRLQNENCNVQFYRIGFMSTSMLGSKKTFLPVSNPDDVAAKILKNLNRDQGMKFIPFWWCYLSWVLSNLPWYFFKKIKV